MVESSGVYGALNDGSSVFVIDKISDICWNCIGRYYNDNPTDEQIIARL